VYEPDSAPANGSSIALLAEYDGKGVLLGADAHSEVLEAGVQRLLAARGKRKLKLDAFKVCHHGSKYNNSPTLVDMLDCPRWLISTNGDKFQHPDRETIARILLSRKNDETDLYFNYRSEYNGIWDSDRLRRDWNYRATYPKSEKGGIVVEL
jgi:beta-lactamase superfamily II metal-dependent hydrolase